MDAVEPVPATLADAQASRAAWTVVALLWGAATLNYLDRQLIATMSAPIEAAIRVHHARFGLFFSVFLWTYGLTSPLAGMVADRFGRKRVIVASLLIWSAATVLTGCVRTFEQMLAARFLMGLSEAFYMPAAVALVVDYHRGPTQSRATGLHLSGVYAGSILGGLGGAIAQYLNWRTGFIGFGVIGLVYCAVLARFLHDAPAAADEDAPNMTASPGSRGFASLLTSRNVALLLAGNAVIGAAFWTMRNWLPTFFNTEAGVDIARAGIYGATAFNAAAFVGMLVAGTLSDCWSARSRRVRVLVPAVAAFAAAPMMFAMGSFSALGVLVGAVLLAGMAQGALDANLMPALCTLVPPWLRSTGYGLLNLAGTLAGGLMTYVGGRLKDANVPFHTTFQMSAALVLLAGLLFAAVRPARARGGDA
ncbi:MAG TPA: MFS transporter [Tepidisphaeraceae bacterium]